jgi:glycogen operon protein
MMLSLGVPMIAAGDELGRTQRGNNNAYCQDNEVSWINWRLASDEQEFHGFVTRVIGLRSLHPVFRRTDFYRGDGGDELHKDIAWLTRTGQEMTTAEWQDPHNRLLACTFSHEPGGGRYYLAFNTSLEPVTFALPGPEASGWRLLLDTAAPDGGKEIVRRTASWDVAERSLVLLFRD